MLKLVILYLAAVCLVPGGQAEPRRHKSTASSGRNVKASDFDYGSEFGDYPQFTPAANRFQGRLFQESPDNSLDISSNFAPRGLLVPVTLDELSNLLGNRPPRTTRKPAKSKEPYYPPYHGYYPPPPAYYPPYYHPHPDPHPHPHPDPPPHSHPYPHPHPYPYPTPPSYTTTTPAPTTTTAAPPATPPPYPPYYPPYYGHYPPPPPFYPPPFYNYPPFPPPFTTTTPPPATTTTVAPVITTTTVDPNFTTTTEDPAITTTTVDPNIVRGPWYPWSSGSNGPESHWW